MKYLKIYDKVARFRNGIEKSASTIYRFKIKAYTRYCNLARSSIGKFYARICQLNNQTVKYNHRTKENLKPADVEMRKNENSGQKDDWTTYQ